MKKRTVKTGFGRDTKKKMKELYRDYTRISDEVTILKNPHKGFYYHYIDNGFTRPTYKNGIKYDKEIYDFPGMNHLYIRFDWSDVEKEKGIYDWSCIDDIMSRWSGMKFSFRLCTYETGFCNSENAVPKWLAETDGTGKIFRCYFNSEGRWLGDSQGDAVIDIDENTVIKDYFEPYYDNATYLEALDKFMAAYAAKYDGDDRVEYIDVGTFGRWGEGHSQTTPYSPEVLKTHVDLHLKHFRNTQILVNDDFIRHLKDADAAEGLELENYCLFHGIGIRDDGICVERFCPKFRYSTLEQPEMLRRYSQFSPVDIELEHYNQISDEFMRDALPYMESLRESHATYSGFHGFTGIWLKKFKPMTDYLANRLGYWYFINGAEFMNAQSGARSILRLYVENKGFARAYNRYNLKVFARSDEKTYILNAESPDNRRWDGGCSYVENIVLDFADVPAGEYKLAIGMYEGDTPVKLAISQDLINDDGSYSVDNIDVLRPHI